jgi:hypothetical protein
MSRPQKKYMKTTSVRRHLALLFSLAALMCSERARAQCAGDCDADGKVTVDELILAVDMALAGAGTAMCSPADTNGNGELSIAELVAAVGKSVNGCGNSNVTLAEVQRRVFTPSCAFLFCHGGGSMSGNLSLTEGASHDQLVNVQPDNPRARQEGFVRVQPNNVDNSFLILKLEGPPSFDYGTQMPQGALPLPEADIQLVRDWINAGAPT